MFKFADEKSSYQKHSRGSATPQVIHHSRLKTLGSQREERRPRLVRVIF